MNTQYRKNLKDVATACKNYTDATVKQAFSDYSWYIGTHNLSPDDDNSTAYTKTVPSGTIKCHINKIGGMSYKYNQLVQNGNFESATGWGYSSYFTLSVSDNTATITCASAYSDYSPFLTKTIDITSGNVFAVIFKAYSSNSNQIRVRSPFVSSITTLTTTDKFYGFVGTSSDTFITLQAYKFAENDTITISNLMVVDITAMYGSGNEPSTYAEFIADYPKYAEYVSYSTGDIDTASVTSVVSKDSNNTTIDTFTIDSNIQALEGYGVGYDTTNHNILNLETKKHTTEWKHIILNKTDYTWTPNASNTLYYCDVLAKEAVNNDTVNKILCDKLVARSLNSIIDGTYTSGICVNNASASTSYRKIAISTSDYNNMTTLDVVYQLVTPVETDISEYIDNGSIEVEAGGTITFNNTYNQAVPSEIDYLIEEVKA